MCVCLWLNNNCFLIPSCVSARCVVGAEAATTSDLLLSWCLSFSTHKLDEDQPACVCVHVRLSSCYSAPSLPSVMHCVIFRILAADSRELDFMHPPTHTHTQIHKQRDTHTPFTLLCLSLSLSLALFQTHTHTHRRT